MNPAPRASGWRGQRGIVASAVVCHKRAKAFAEPSGRGRR